MNESSLLLQTLPATPFSLRVAVVTETYPPEINGVAMTMERMVKGLQARNHQVQLIRPKQNSIDKVSSFPRFEEVLRPGLSIPRYEGLKMGLPAKSALTRLWMMKRPDIVHIATEGPLGWSALSAAIKLRLPAITDFHTNFQTYSQHYGLGMLGATINSYLRKFHNKGRVTLVPTESLREELQQLGYNNLMVLGRGVDTQLFQPLRRQAELRHHWNATENDTVALFVSRLASEKNLLVVIETWLQMRTINPRTKLVMVGDGPERAALQAAHPEVIFSGTRTGMDLAEHYASADVFLFPSTTETYGNVTMEAMASGLAVVAYDYAAAHEHIQHQQNGLLAKFNDVDDFAHQAMQLATDSQHARHLGNNARRTTETLDWEKIHDTFEAALLDVLHELETGRPQSA